MDVGSLFSRHARYRADHPAFVFQDTRLSYAELNAEINRVANGLLDQGVRKGHTVATILPNSPELYEIYWACGKIGAVVVPMSTLLLGQALKTLLNDLDSVVVITCSDFAGILDGIRAELTAIPGDRFFLIDKDEVPGFQSYQALKSSADPREPEADPVRPEDPFNIMYSSGTTGLPKGIVHTHRTRCMYGLSFASAYRMTPESVTLHAGAIVFNGAFVDLMPTIFLGATYILLPRFDPEEYIEIIAREKVSHVMMVPAQIIALLKTGSFHPDKLESLEMILSLGAPLPRKYKEALNEQLPGRFYELYGVTEGVITVLDKVDFQRKPDSVGSPLPFFDIRILDEQGEEVPAGTVGEICGTGPVDMQGYHKRPELTEKTIVDGLTHTGDLGYLDEDGYLYLVDRKKDMIVSGGVNVYPKDIEDVAIEHPDVNEAAVFGVPDERWGETPLVAVVLCNGASVDARELMDWINARVGAKFQRVKEVTILEEFPRNVAGKILKRDLRKPFWDPR